MNAHSPFRRTPLAGLALAALLGLGPLAPQSQTPAPAAPQDTARKQEMQALGAKFPTGWALYQGLQSQMPAQAMKEVDWSGVWTRGKGGLQFDPDLPQASLPVTAKLTPQAQQRLQAKVRQLKETGGEYDPISDCRPPGTPRWFSEPFLREFVVTRNQTWLMNEMVNDVRRAYTDGRPHTSEADAVPTANGDTIGFWSGDMLIMHTTQLLSGQYQRGVQPDYSDKVEVVERWRKVDDRNIHVDLWIYDPVNLVQPWYTRQIYTRLSDPDKNLRLRYWDCRENTNNEILVKGDGTSQFKAFNFVPDNAKVSNDPAVKAAQPAR